MNLEQTKKMAALVAINDELRDRSFNICTLDSVGKMLGIPVGGEAYNILRTLHCVPYSSMPPELRSQIPELVRQCLGIEPNYQFVQPMMPEEPAAKPAATSAGRLMKLLTGGS